MATVQITYEAECEASETTYKVDLECELSNADKDVGWQGHLSDWTITSVAPSWGRPLEELYGMLDPGRIEILAYQAYDQGEAL